MPKISSYEPHYVVSSSFLAFHSSSIQIFSSPCTEICSVFACHLMSETEFQTHEELQEKL
jgi:hypothetical protein